ncbi:hypothetical protein AWZ03_004428 [Drosophila navojoa]|uniref:Uncharacterized protein n=1 Tax=Drosophila navojoa TaxID=7232 RepID=A0A484BK60_DRONA|nr:hypothetical protein AWZ03_004428 [Drosophila navojoa]
MRDGFSHDPLTNKWAKGKRNRNRNRNRSPAPRTKLKAPSTKHQDKDQQEFAEIVRLLFISCATKTTTTATTQ